MDQLVDHNQEFQFVSQFRAVTLSGGRRRGIKLEEIFWNVLHNIAQEREMSIGSLIEDIETQFADGKNLTSILRVQCLDWLKDKKIALEAVTCQENIKNLLYACPTPAIALVSTKQLIAYNKPFLAFVSSAFPTTNHFELASKLRLVLDTQIQDIFIELEKSRNRPVNVGVAIGVELNNRLRAKMNVIALDRDCDKILIGYIDRD